MMHIENTPIASSPNSLSVLSKFYLLLNTLTRLLLEALIIGTNLNLINLPRTNLYLPSFISNFAYAIRTPSAKTTMIIKIFLNN